MLGARVSKVTAAPKFKAPGPWTSKTAEAGVMVQRDDHQKSPRYRASSLPNISGDNVNSGRISTQGVLEKAHYSDHATSNGDVPRGGAKSDHSRSGDLKLKSGSAGHGQPSICHPREGME